MRSSLFAVVIMLSASGALAAGPNGITTDTGAMMDAAKIAAFMPEEAVSFADARALWANTEVPIMGINRRPLGLSSD